MADNDNVVVFPLTDPKDIAAKARESWQYRAILETRGPNTKTGAILLAILGKQRNTRPQFGNHAIIGSSGFVCAHFIDKQGRNFPMQAICMADHMIGEFRKLADNLKLSDPERIEMFDKLRVWISKDHRAVRDWAIR